MKRPSITLAAVIALFAVSANAQNCDRPSMINVPNGATSSLEQMLDAQSTVRDFLSSMETYLDCMNEQIEDSSGDDEASVDANTALVDDYNSGVTEMETIAAQFNEERIAYQEANPSN